MNQILIIEDDQLLLDSITDFLAEEGFEVLSARNGDEGIEMATNHLPDLILCDILMPRKNGYEVFDTLKRQIDTSLTPFIFLTAKTEKDDILYGMKLGADDYITKPVDFMELIRRISRRLEKSQATVRRSEVKFHAVFETAHDIIFLIRISDHHIIDVNEAACKILLYTKEELLNKSGEELLDEINQQQTIQQLGLNCKMMPGFLNVDTYWKTKDGRKVALQVSGRRVELLKEACMFLSARDVTDLKAKEKALYEFENRLILAQEKAEESDRLKASILSNISHELRTPLNGILGFSEILVEELKGTEYYVMVENIFLSGLRLMSTLNSLITLSQLQSGKVTLVYKDTDLLPVVESVVKSFLPETEKKGISLTINERKPINIYTDPLLFKQLFRQLLDNAVKFTQEGGVRVFSKKVSQEGITWQTITIRDSGIGITSEFYDLIFNEFRQVSEGYNRKFQGAGLGLTISRKICDLLHGKITFESNPGQGSSFTIWLPESTTEVSAEDKLADRAVHIPSGPEDQSEKKPALLLVEDNLVNKNLIELYLKPDYILDYAPDGKRAVRMAEAMKYNAILMDINLGTGMDGIQTANEIKKIPGYQQTPIIAVTGYTMVGDREKLLAEGCTHYIAKPFEKAEFLAVIKEAIRKAK